ncbi:MAG: CoA transferase [Rhodospirillales bacterium]|nr:CoA transferase [Rhodospirillales bacterium]
MDHPAAAPVPPPGPLSGVTILDLTRVLAGPFATMILGDLGARVIKVEPPDGDDARTFPPWIGDTSAYFGSLNRGKESIALDLKDDADRSLFGQLLERADVLVENFRPGALGRLGFGWDVLHARHPRLILASTSGFGQTGPWATRPAYDMIVQGMGGLMSLTGHADGPPTRVGTSIGDIAAGLFTAVGIAAALHERNRTGLGQRIDVAMLDCQIAILENAVARYFATGVAPPPSGARHPAIAPFGCYRAADAHLVLAAGNDRMFQTLVTVLGQPELAEDPRFATNRGRIEHVESLEAELNTRFQTAPRAEWLAKLEAAGIPAGPLNDVADAVASPQVHARNMLVEVAGGSVGGMKVAGNPIKLSGHQDPPTRGPVPELDADRAGVLELVRDK